MPEAVAERQPTPEIRKASNGLMLHIAHGEFDTNKTNALDKNPKQIAEKSFDALLQHHTNTRAKQQEEIYDQIKKGAAADPDAHGELTAEQLRHLHFVAWAKVESFRIGALFRQQNGSPEGQEAVKNALGKLHITINDNVDVTNLPDQFYNPTAREEGSFYKEFCTGNSNKKLVDTLAEQDIVVLKDFLIDMLGSKTAYDALLATKQTADAIQNKHDFSTDSTSIGLHEHAILDFFSQGKSNKKDSNIPTQNAEYAFVTIDGGYTLPNPDHPQRNDDTSFLDTKNLRGGIFDGAGGYSGADKASKAALVAIREVMDRFPLNGYVPEAPVREQLLEAFALANDRVKALGGGMTTAAVWQVVRSQKDGLPKLLIANVGDSRVWIRHKDGTVTQITRDANALRDLHRKELSTIPSSTDPRFQEERDAEIQHYEGLQRILDNASSDADFAADPRLKAAWNSRNQTSLLGSDDFKEHFEFFESSIQQGDTVFATTDGVHDNLTREQIEAIARNTPNADELSKALVQKARMVADTYETANQQYRAKPDDITALGMTLENTTSLNAKEPAPQPSAQIQTPQSPISDENGDIAGVLKAAIGDAGLEAMIKKASEYAERIEAMQAGNPKPGDEGLTLQELLRDYEGRMGLPYHRLYNVLLPNWLSPKLNDLPSGEQLQRVNDILTNFNTALAKEPDPLFFRQIHFSMNPAVLKQSFGIDNLAVLQKRHEEPNIRGGGTHTRTEWYLNRQITSEDLQKISDKLAPVGWHAVTLETSGPEIQFHLERNIRA